MLSSSPSPLGQQPLRRRPFVGPWSRRLALLLGMLPTMLWVVLGSLSYGTVWMLLVQDEQQSYTVIAMSLQKKKQEQLTQKIVVEEISKPQERRVVEQTQQAANHNKNLRSRQPQTQHNNADELLYDWSFWCLCVCFLLMAYVRIRLEPSRRREAAATHRRRRAVVLGMIMTDEATVIQTLQRLNEFRQARGETPISLDSYQALRRALLQDRALLRGLAGHNVPPPSRGATPEQLESCRQRIISSNDNGEESCCICLASYQTNDQVRILPCHHSYHKGCIDVWFEQSTLCPICKTSLETTTSSSSDNALG